MAYTRFIPISVAVVLAIIIVALAATSVKSAVYTPQTITLRVGYPDSLDEGDVSDLYAYSHILAQEGINVIPTYYDAPPLSYKGLVSGQQDIALVSATSEWEGVAQGEQTTVVACYAIGGTFLMIAGQNITKPQQLIGKAVDDFGPGSETRALDQYWLNTSGVPYNSVGPNPNSVYLRASGDNIARVNDLEKNVVQAITVDDFILSDLSSPSVNNTAQNGPFHVLFYTPINVLSVCYAVRDDWLSNPHNQQVLIKFIEAIYEAQRYFILHPNFAIKYEEQQLPLTPPSEIQYVTYFYPQHMTYWPYGNFNLLGPLSIQNLFENTNKFMIINGVISQPLSNSSVKPYGVINGYFELQALKALGPFNYPCQPWVNQQLIMAIQEYVPQEFGSPPTNCHPTNTTFSS